MYFVNILFSFPRDLGADSEGLFVDRLSNDDLPTQPNLAAAILMQAAPLLTSPTWVVS